VSAKRRLIVEEYWSGVVRRLQAEVEVFNKLIGHAGEQGRENELALSKVLERLLPQRVGVGSGMVIDSEGRVSKQTDLVLFDQGDQPTLLAQANQLIYPVEAVQVVIEVKTTLTSDDLDDCREKVKAMSALVPAGVGKTPLFALLAYESEIAPATLAAALRAAGPMERLGLVCVVSPSLLGGPAAVPACTAYPFGLIALHARKDDGSREAGLWATAPDKGRHALIGTTRYPVARVNKARYLGDPGRALLLFCDALLREFHVRGTCGRSSPKSLPRRDRQGVRAALMPTREADWRSRPLLAGPVRRRAGRSRASQASVIAQRVGRGWRSSVTTQTSKS